MQTTFFRILFIYSSIYIAGLSACSPYETGSSTPPDTTRYEKIKLARNSSIVTWIVTDTDKDHLNGFIPIDSGTVTLYGDTLYAVRIFFNWDQYRMTDNTKDSVVHRYQMDSLLGRILTGGSSMAKVSVEFYDLHKLDSAGLDRLDTTFQDHYFLEEANFLSNARISLGNQVNEVVVPFSSRKDEMKLLVRSFIPFCIPMGGVHRSPDSANTSFTSELSVYIETPVE